MAFSDSSKGELQLTEAQAEAVQKALRYWRHSNLVPASLVGDLLATVRIVEEKHGFDWDKFAKYTSRLSVVCLAIAIASLVFGRAIPNIIKRILALPAAVRVAITSALAATVHVWAYDRSLTTPQQLYLNEAIHSLGALLFGLAALQVTIALQADKRENLHTLHNIELSLALVYGVSAVLVQSNFIWSCGMVVLGIWFGSWSAYASGTYYIGMRYPLRFVLFGASIIIVSSFMRDHTITFILWSTTRIWGMLYLFVALWMLSLFGNDGVRGDNYGGLGRMAFWSVAFLCAASTAIWHGLRYGDSTMKGFGLTFLGINLYTKFFEFCWSTWYKSVFFTALALSLALMGRYAESMNAALYERYPSLAT
ncbi:putative membrane protein [Rosellinia necatrix]|uniref:Putative membrane protein n=1 Tax=Rosellinia necatrix TaxID=77044 RepID=A0A1W2TEU3_ROSNE|nr:putative membrane protein [Rosellinia necatrix]